MYNQRKNMRQENRTDMAKAMYAKLKAMQAITLAKMEVTA
jgi:hypothetical protein